MKCVGLDLEKKFAIGLEKVLAFVLYKKSPSLEKKVLLTSLCTSMQHNFLTTKMK